MFSLRLSVLACSAVAYLICGVNASESAMPTMMVQQPAPLQQKKKQQDILEAVGEQQAAAAAQLPVQTAKVSLDEKDSSKDDSDDLKKKEKKILKSFTLFPAPTPNFLAAFFAGILWLTIFCTGFCALFGLQTPQKFVEKGLLMSKEY